jgi:hypothetical protein
MTYISRNPFVRTETHRETVRTSRTCDWCGQNRCGRLYVYSTKHDGGRTEEHKGEFCCKSCHDSYHGN